jgi:hypothetical protein
VYIRVISFMHLNFCNLLLRVLSQGLVTATEISSNFI